MWGSPDPNGKGDPSNYPYIQTTIYVKHNDGKWAVTRAVAHRGWSERPIPNVPNRDIGGHLIFGSVRHKTLASELPSREAAVREAIAVMEATSAIAPPVPPVAPSHIDVGRHGETTTRATDTLEYATYHGVQAGAAMVDVFDLAALHDAAKVESVRKSTPDGYEVPSPKR